MKKSVSISAKIDQGFAVSSEIRGHQVKIDQPKDAMGTDTGPTPLELLMFSLGGCVLSIARIIAKQRKLPVRGISLTVGGELDTDGLLGKETDQRIGFTGFTIEAEVDADMTLEEKQAFLEEVDHRCPVSENLLNASPVTIRAVG